jgi:hypothetical protein
LFSFGGQARPRDHSTHRHHAVATVIPHIFACRYEAAGGQYYVCPICFDARHLDGASLIDGAELQGTVPMWGWIGDEGATTFSY